MSRLLPLACLILLGCGPGDTGPETATEATVEFSFEYDGKQDDRTFELKTTSGSSILEAMQAAREQKLLTFETDGSSGLPFVTTIDGTTGEGAGSGSRNWQYWINGDYATLGVGQATLEDGDRIKWKYATYDEVHAEDD